MAQHEIKKRITSLIYPLVCHGEGNVILERLICPLRPLVLDPFYYDWWLYPDTGLHAGTAVVVGKPVSVCVFLSQQCCLEMSRHVGERNHYSEFTITPQALDLTKPETKILKQTRHCTFSSNKNTRTFFKHIRIKPWLPIGLQITYINLARQISV